MERRQRKVVETSDRTCPECGNRGLAIIRSRRVRSGLQRLNPVWRANRRTYESCPTCGARFAAPTIRRGAAVPEGDSSLGWSLIGWLLLGLLALVVIVETVVLAGMASLVSSWLSAGVVALVIASVLLIVWGVRRKPSR